MNSPTISVVIPNWNGAATLSDTIHSCLNQTLAPLEVLVCDDGSTDSSSAIVSEMNDSRVRWIPGVHSGTPASPRNRGLAVAQGEWIAFCDSDDTWKPEKLEKQLATVTKSSSRVISTNAVKKIAGVITPQLVSGEKKKVISFNTLLKGNTIICSSVLMKKSLYEEIGGFPENPAYAGFEDYMYWLRITTKTTVVFVHEALVIYDDHPETSVRSRFLSGILLKKAVLADFSKWAKEHKLYGYLIQLRLYKTYQTLKTVLRTILTYATKNTEQNKSS